MNTLNKNLAITALLSTSYLFSGVATAAEGIATDATEADVTTNSASTDNNINEDDEITISFNHPQSLAVSAPNNEANRASGGVINKTWHIVSNNAVGVRFSGRAPNDVGVEKDVPNFYKAEVDASGTKIANADATGFNYDHLVTTYAVDIANEGSTYNKSTIFGTSATAPAETPINLVTARDGDKGPGMHFGSIMPNDDGNFTMTLSAKGVGDVATTQSGDYQVTIVASFIAEEKGNGTITAATEDFLTTSLVQVIEESATLDNSGFQDTTATGVVVSTDGTAVSTTTGGVQLSPEVYSTAADDTDAANE
jgi:hypothetical protein